MKSSNWCKEKAGRPAVILTVPINLFLGLSKRSWDYDLHDSHKKILKALTHLTADSSWLALSIDKVPAHFPAHAWQSEMLSPLERESRFNCNEQWTIFSNFQRPHFRVKSSLDSLRDSKGRECFIRIAGVTNDCNGRSPDHRCHVAPPNHSTAKDYHRHPPG